MKLVELCQEEARAATQVEHASRASRQMPQHLRMPTT
jgi:hypothetical protein